MIQPIKVLLAGESWTSYTVHIKGFDSFTTSDYAEGATQLIGGLKQQGVEVTFIPNHNASRDFPNELDELKGYDVVLLSDIGSNTLLLHPDTFIRSEPKLDRCELLAEYVKQGGGLAMIGGYLSFSGIDGKARYQKTPLREILPVIMVDGDDRVEVPCGIQPKILVPEHPIFKNVSSDWPHFLGYNQLKPAPDGTVLATIGEDVFIAIGERGRGRSAAFASDCGPHWGPPSFVAWDHYVRFWTNLVLWLAKKVR